MISRTKYKIDNATIEKLFQAAGTGQITEITPLGAGEYNAVFTVKEGEKEYVLKIAPKSNIPVLTYEKDMMVSEVFWYSQMKAHTQITVPQIYYSDFGKKLIPTNYFIMEKLSGRQMDQMEFSEEERTSSTAEMARMAAQIHKIKNDKFGYIQNELYDNWYLAIRGMVQAAIKDCRRKGKGSRRGKKLLAYIDKYKNILEKAECSMVNFDIWAPNILCQREDSEIKYSWIDPERSFWGDRIADFVCLEVMTPLADKKISLKAYNEVSDRPVLATKEEKIRWAVAQAYLALIMETEKYYRYSLFHYGWWRNVSGADKFFIEACNVLDQKNLD